MKVDKHIMLILGVLLISSFIVISFSINTVGAHTVNGNNIVYNNEKISKEITTENIKTPLKFKTESSGIQQVGIHPSSPEYKDNVTVYAIIHNASSVYLNWTIDFSLFHVSEMNLTQPLNDNYTAIIPAQEYGVYVYFKVKAILNDNSTQETNWLHYFVDDFTEPVFYWANISSKSFITLKEVTITANVSDDGSGVYFVRVFIYWSEDNKTFYPYDDYVLTESNGLYLVNVSFADSGYYRMYFYAEDVAGNGKDYPRSDYIYFQVKKRTTRLLYQGSLQVRYSDYLTIDVFLEDLNASTSKGIGNAHIEAYIDDNIAGLFTTSDSGWAQVSIYIDYLVGNHTLKLVFQETTTYSKTTLELSISVIAEKNSSRIQHRQQQQRNVLRSSEGR